MSFDFKNASQADRKREYDRIAKELGDDQFFTKKELNHLPEVLSDGEQERWTPLFGQFFLRDKWILLGCDRTARCP